MSKKSVTFFTLGGGSSSVFVTLFKNMFKMCSNKEYKNELFFFYFLLHFPENRGESDPSVKNVTLFF